VEPITIECLREELSEKKLVTIEYLREGLSGEKVSQCAFGWID
jgi:hypothetical protein